jgi:hypothetical protein
MSPSLLDSTRQPWWVQTAENALKSPSVGWVTTTLADATTKHPPTGTSATLARAEPPALGVSVPSALGEEGDSSLGDGEVDEEASVDGSSPELQAASTGTPTAIAADPVRARRLLMAVMRRP